jgi:hypothetical protein
MLDATRTNKRIAAGWLGILLGLAFGWAFLANPLIIVGWAIATGILIVTMWAMNMLASY